MNQISVQNQLHPNFAEIDLAINELDVYLTEYSNDLFNECISLKDSGYFFYRDSNFIYALPEKNELSRPDGFEKKQINIKSHPYIFSKMIEIAFKIFFESIGRCVYRKKYSSVSVFQIKSESPFKIGELELVPNCEYSIHPIIKKNKIVFIITISKEYKPYFDQEIDIYNEKGIDTRDWFIKNGKIIATRANIKKYLERTNLQSKYDNAIIDLGSKKNEFEFIQKTFDFLKKHLENIKSPSIKLQFISFLSIPNVNFENTYINKPMLYYYNKKTTRGLINTALEQLKPLSYDVFSYNQISICVFIPKLDAKQCERFINNLHQKLKSIFHLYDVNIKNIYVDNDRKEHLNIISNFSNKEYELAILFLYNIDKNQIVEKSAYNRLKAKLISKQIPSQTILVENARKNNEFTLNNVSLNIYSKLGGTPWAIEKDGLDENEFIIGIGSTIDIDGVRNIGFASVFDHFGSYMVGSCTPLCRIEDYKKELYRYISTILTEIIDERTIIPGSKIRLIFHLFKSASQKYELSAINKCLEDFIDFDIEYAIVNISYEHPFKLFNNVTEQLIRGCYIQLTDYKALLCMGGKGSRPLQIKLDCRSTYKDLYELSKQILFFSHLSHRSFKPGNSPVTTVYPKRLAKLTSDLLTINHWDVDMLNRMKDKLWFI